MYLPDSGFQIASFVYSDCLPVYVPPYWGRSSYVSNQRNQIRMPILADEMVPRIPRSHSNIDSSVTDHLRSWHTKSSCAFLVFRADYSSDSDRK